MICKPEILTIPKAAAYCGVTRMTMWRWVKSGLVEVSVTPGGHHRISKKDLASFLRQRGMYPLGTRHYRRDRLLIVDDDPLIQKTLPRVLRDYGYKTETAGDGFEAGIKIMRFQPDLVLLDLFMPRMDGFEVCRYLRADPLTARIKILVLSGYKAFQQNALAAGADAFLEKPVPEEVLLEHLERLLGKEQKNKNSVISNSL